MLNWRSVDVARVEQACDRVAKALLTNTNSADSSKDLFPPFTSEACGSFPVRTSIGLQQPPSADSSDQNSNNNNSIIYNADICFEIPEDLCDTKDVEMGSYLEKRDQMMEIAYNRIQSYLVVSQNNKYKQQKETAAAANEDNKNFSLVATSATLEYQPGSGNQKRNVRITFKTNNNNQQHSSSSSSSSIFAIVTVFCRPRHAGSVNSASGIKTKKFANSVSGFYGPLVVEDLIMPRLAKAHADINDRSTAFPIAAQLLRKWATSTAGLVSGSNSDSNSSSGSILSGGLNLFTVVTAPMLMLLAEGTITPSSNVDSMVRAVWIYWSKFANISGITASTSEDAAAPPTASSPMLSLHIPSEPHLNIFHRLLANTTSSSSGNAPSHIDSLVAVGEAAAGALKVGGSIEKLLSPILSMGSSVLERFDAVVRASININTAATTNKSKFYQNELVQRLLCGQLQMKLKNALASRASTIVVGCTRSTSNNNNNNSNNNNNNSNVFDLVVACEFTTEPAARSRLFKGPVIDEKKACGEFENLWGSDFVTTRQFADGSINKCVVLPHPLDLNSTNSKIVNSRFDFADPCSGVRAVGDAIEILVNRHVFLVNKEIESQNKTKKTTDQDSAVPTTASSSSSAVKFAEVVPSSFELCAGAELLSSLFQLDATSCVPRDAEPYSAAIRADAVEAIKDKLNEIAETSLPCKIANVEFVSPSERGTDPFPPLPHLSILNSSSSNWVSNSATLSPIHAIIQIEDRKNKIPDNLEAISQLKSVLMAQMAKGFETSVGFSVHVSRSFADVLHHESGFIFRLSTVFEREILVMRQTNGKEVEATNMSRSMIWTQRHAQFMRSGILVQYASAAGACRLLRRWICTMNLGDYIPNEVSELLIAYVYLSKPRLASKVFCTAHTAFLAALRLIASFPFETSPLVFPEVDTDRAYLVWREEVRRHQQQNSNNGNGNANNTGAGNKVPSVAQRAMFIAAPYTEPDHSPFTELTPRRGIVQTLKKCAAAAIATYSSSPLAPTTNIFAIDTDSSFTFTLVATDSAVNKFAVNPFPAASSSSSTNNGSSISTRVMPKIASLSDSEAKQLLSKTIETNAVTSTVRSLRRQFRDRCMIFYDEYNAGTGVNGVEFGNFSTYNKTNKVSSLPHEMFNSVNNSNNNIGSVLVQPPKVVQQRQQQQQQQQKGKPNNNNNNSNNSGKPPVKANEGKQKAAIAGKKNAGINNKNQKNDKQQTQQQKKPIAQQQQQQQQQQPANTKKPAVPKQQQQQQQQKVVPVAAASPQQPATKKVPFEKKKATTTTVNKKPTAAAATAVIAKKAVAKASTAATATASLVVAQQKPAGGDKKKVVEKVKAVQKKKAKKA